MSWFEAKEKCKDKIILVPHGSIEQHGYHLPLKTDAAIAERVCEEFYNSKEIVVAPVIEYTGVGREKPGTIGMDEGPDIDILRTIIKDILKLKPKKIVFFFGHNWGKRSEERLLPLKKDFGEKVVFIHSLSWLAEKEGIIETGGHGGEGETSLMLFIDPDSVKMERAVNDIWPRKGPGHMTSESGVDGYPSKATKEKGKLMLEFYIQKLKEATVE